MRDFAIALLLFFVGVRNGEQGEALVFMRPTLLSKVETIQLFGNKFAFPADM